MDDQRKLDAPELNLESQSKVVENFQRSAQICSSSAGQDAIHSCSAGQTSCKRATFGIFVHEKKPHADW